MALPGVKVGPLDPDATSGFGQVSQTNSARQLIRLHNQMYPPELKRALVRPRDDERTKGLDDDEVQEYVSGLTHDNGDPVIPEGAHLIPGAAAVRGERRGDQLLTFTFELESGRVGKWFAPYNADVLPDSHAAGSEFVKVREMKDRGIVSFDSEGTRAEIAERRLRESQRENRALRTYAERGGDGDPPEEGETVELDTRGGATLAEENERLARTNQELLEKLSAYKALEQAQSGGVPTAGLAEALPPQDQVASADPPVEGYDDLKADEAVKLLRSEDTDGETRRRILEYERTHANRKSVTSAGEQALGSGD